MQGARGPRCGGRAHDAGVDMTAEWHCTPLFDAGTAQSLLEDPARNRLSEMRTLHVEDVDKRGKRTINRDVSVQYASGTILREGGVPDVVGVFLWVTILSSGNSRLLRLTDFPTKSDERIRTMLDLGGESRISISDAVREGEILSIVNGQVLAVHLPPVADQKHGAICSIALSGAIDWHTSVGSLIQNTADVVLSQTSSSDWPMTYNPVTDALLTRISTLVQQRDPTVGGLDKGANAIFVHINGKGAVIRTATSIPYTGTIAEAFVLAIDQREGSRFAQPVSSDTHHNALLVCDRNITVQRSLSANEQEVRDNIARLFVGDAPIALGDDLTCYGAGGLRWVDLLPWRVLPSTTSCVTHVTPGRETVETYPLFTQRSTTGSAQCAPARMFLHAHFGPGGRHIAWLDVEKVTGVQPSDVHFRISVYERKREKPAHADRITSRSDWNKGLDPAYELAWRQTFSLGESPEIAYGLASAASDDAAEYSDGAGPARISGGIVPTAPATPTHAYVLLDKPGAHAIVTLGNLLETFVVAVDRDGSSVLAYLRGAPSAPTGTPPPTNSDLARAAARGVLLQTSFAVQHQAGAPVGGATALENAFLEQYATPAAVPPARQIETMTDGVVHARAPSDIEEAVESIVMGDPAETSPAVILLTAPRHIGDALFAVAVSRARAAVAYNATSDAQAGYAHSIVCVNAHTGKMHETVAFGSTSASNTANVYADNGAVHVYTTDTHAMHPNAPTLLVNHGSRRRN